MTTTVTVEEAQVCVFIAVDHCTAESIGVHASKSGNRFEGLAPLRQGVREHFGGFDKCIGAGLAIRHDHVSASMSDDFQRELTFLGMTSSPSFVREPEGNGVAERFIRTLKKDPTATCTLHTRTRCGYNGIRDRLPLGFAGSGPLVPGSALFPRRICTMPRHPSTVAPPRA